MKNTICNDVRECGPPPRAHRYISFLGLITSCLFSLVHEHCCHFYNKIENEKEDLFLLGLIKIKKEMRGSV